MPSPGGRAGGLGGGGGGARSLAAARRDFAARELFGAVDDLYAATAISGADLVVDVERAAALASKARALAHGLLALWRQEEEEEEERRALGL